MQTAKIFALCSGNVNKCNFLTDIQKFLSEKDLIEKATALKRFEN